MTFFIFFIGSIIGSFLNVCIYRIPREESIIFPPSHCTSCKNPLKWYDLFPVLSYLMLKGRCRYCKVKISPVYPIIELLNALIYILLLLKFGFTINFIKFALLSSLLLVISAIDLFTTDIYTNTIVFGLIMAALFIIISFFVQQKILTYILGGLVGGGVIALIIITTKGMGWGDAELLLVIGLFLGIKSTILTILLSFILGGFIGFMLIALKIKSRKDYIPFGPFISLGALISILWGDLILKYYFL